MRNIFILLTRSQTVLSRVIRRATGDTYTHVSIAYDDGLQTLCSFARRRAALPVPAGAGERVRLRWFSFVLGARVSDF